MKSYSKIKGEKNTFKMLNNLRYEKNTFKMLNNLRYDFTPSPTDNHHKKNFC